MSEAKCKKCKDFILWLEIESDVWRPFDYGKEMATLDNPLVSSQGVSITSGLGFVSHFKTCEDRIRAAQAQVRKDHKAREERREKRGK